MQVCGVDALLHAHVLEASFAQLDRGAVRLDDELRRVGLSSLDVLQGPVDAAASLLTDAQDAQRLGQAFVALVHLVDETTGRYLGDSGIRHSDALGGYGDVYAAVLHEVLMHAGVGDDLANGDWGEIAMLVAQPACEILAHGQQGVDLVDEDRKSVV